MTSMRWALSDGTVVTSDGSEISVEGGSLGKYLAQRAAEGVLVPEYPAPGGQVALNPSSARNIDAWLEYEISLTGAQVLITERPTFEPLPTPPDDQPNEQGAYRVY